MKFGRPSIPPEKLLRALAAAGAVHDSERAAADRADRVQPAVSLVRGPRHGRRRVGADDVYQESRSPAGRRHRRGVLRCGVDPRRHGAAALGRALHRRRHAAGGVGQSEEFPAARSGSARPTAAAIRPSIFTASGAATRPISPPPIPMRGCTRKRAGREARLGYLGHVLMEHRSGLIVKTRVTPADGHGERDAAIVMVADSPGSASNHGGRRQGLRHARPRRRSAAHARHPAHRAERDRPGGSAIDGAHDAASRLRDQPTEAEARRTRRSAG